MRVAIDISPITRVFPSGVTRVVRATLEALEVRDDINVVPIAPPDRGRLIAWRQTSLPRTVAAVRADVLHSFTSAFTLRCPVPVVQTVHEAPWQHGARENAGPVHRLWVSAGKRWAAATCVPSIGVADDLGAHPNLRVVSWGVSDRFTSTRDETDDLLREAIPGLPEGPYVLSLGNRQKKRLDRICAGAKLAKLPVVATGRVTPFAEAVRARFSSLTLLGEVNERFIPALVRASGCLAVLSKSEGFALPVLEAMRSGRPVVTAARTVQAKTAMGTAIEVDARDAGAVSRGLLMAIHASPQHRLMTRAVAEDFTWERTADDLVRLWRSLA
jgi:glycosyltransferase involved in cell wall biosynthesis